MSFVHEYYGVLKMIDLRLFVLSGLLFLIGVIVSPWVVKNNVRVLPRYPMWIWKLIQTYFNPQDHSLKLFLFIFFLNSTSLLCNVLSGFLIVAPILFALFLGMHVGIIVFKETGRWGLSTIFLNPVSVFELPAAWISLSAGMEIGISFYGDFMVSHVLDASWKGLQVYGFVVIPLLVISGLIEITIIKMSLGKLPNRGN